MNLYYEGLEVYFNPWIIKDNIFRTDDNQIIMHPYNGACMMLENTPYNYSDVFKIIGINKNSINACGDYALKQLYAEIDNM